MILLDNLYNITERTVSEGKASFEIALNPGAEIYKGHFPGNPITPGVVMIRIAGELLSLVIGRDMKLKEVVSVKYLSVISPVYTPSVNYALDKITVADDCCSVQVTVSEREVLFSKMSLKFKLS